MSYNMFEEYKREGEPNEKQRAENWAIAIGLQQVDNLTPSNYLIETAKENIEGKITIEEVKQRVDSYYKTEKGKLQGERKEEADKVSAHIADILSDGSFTFSPMTLYSIHRRLFGDIFPKIAGKIRDYNITKEELVLNGDTVRYGTADLIKETLDYDFDVEKKFKYKGLSLQAKVERIADFISGIWQIHPFGEGNTRTIAIFTIKYLRTMGFDASNEYFEKNAKYFRDALVRANYQDLKNDIAYSKEYLYDFFDNLLLGGEKILSSKDLFVKTMEKTVKTMEKKIETMEKTGKTREKIISLIEQNSKVTTKELSTLIGITEKGVEWQLTQLKKNKLIIRVGSNNGGHWLVLNDKTNMEDE